VATPLNGEAYRSVEDGDLVGPEPPGLPLPQAHPGHRHSVLELVVHGGSVAPDPDHAGEGIQALPGGVDHQLRGIQDETGALEFLPTGYLPELGDDA
jgi:hypothetical protein